MNMCFKKIDISRFGIQICILVTLLLGISVTSCTGESENEQAQEPKVIIQDAAEVISPAIKDSLEHLPVNNVLAIESVSSIDMANIESSLERAYKDAGLPSNGILVLGVNNNNTCFIKYGEKYAGLKDMSLGYGSTSYYALQLDARMPLDEKMWLMARCAIESIAQQGNNRVYDIVRDEVLGFAFELVEPGDDAFYRYVIYPFQYPLIKSISITGSYYYGFALYALIVYLVYVSLLVYLQKHLFPEFLEGTETQAEYEIKMRTWSSLVRAVLLGIPWGLGALTFATIFSFSGIEEVSKLHECLDMPYNVIDNLFMSEISTISLLWIVITNVIISMASGADGVGRLMALGFMIVTLFTPIALNYAFCLYFLPAAYYGTRRSYAMLRAKKLGGTVSSTILVIGVVVTIGISILGCTISMGWQWVKGDQKELLSTIDYTHADLTPLQDVMPR